MILDLGLPCLDGIDVAKRIRKDYDVLILMLRWCAVAEARVAGPDAPARTTTREAVRAPGVARRACARHAAAHPTAGSDGCPTFRLNPAQHQAFRGDRPLQS